MTYNPFTTENLINEAEFPLTKGGPGSGRTKTLFHIKDWAGNTLFGGKTFPSFQEGWSHIYENVPAEDDEASNYDDYYVLPVNGVWPDEEVTKGGPGSGRKPEGGSAPLIEGNELTVTTKVNIPELLNSVCRNMSYWGSWFQGIEISNGKDTGTVGYTSEDKVLGASPALSSPTKDWSKVTFTVKCDDPENGDDGDHSAVKTANMSDIARAYSQYNENYSHLGPLDDTDAIGTDAFWQLVFYGDVVYG
jgi:hypothetical protein